MKARTRIATVIAAFAALSMFASSALASSGVTINSFSNSPDTAGDPVETVTSVDTTTNYDWLKIELNGGIDINSGFAQDDKIGEVDLNAKFFFTFCSRRDYNFGVYAEASIDPGAPAGTVQQLWIDTPTGKVPAYIVEASNGDFSIEVDTSSTSTCSSDPDATIVVTTYTHVGNNSANAVVATNSATTGTYDLDVTITDTNNNDHTDSTTYTVN